MDHINVYVESFTSVLPARELPIACSDAIREALRAVQETDDLYHDDNRVLTVDPNWHRAAVLDFGDWVQCHIPDFDLYMFVYQFGELPFVQDWNVYAAQEMAEELDDIITETYGTPAPDELAQSQLVADNLTSLGYPVTLSVFCELEGIDTVFIPQLPDAFDLHELGEINPDDIHDAFGNDGEKQLIFFSLMSMVALACLKSQSASIAYVIHDHDTNTEVFGMYAFTAGHVAPISDSDFAQIMDVHADKEAGFDFLQVLGEYSAKSDFEAYVQSLAGTITAAIRAGIEIAYEHATKQRVSNESNDKRQINLGVVGNVPMILARSLTGDFAGEIGPMPDDEDKAISSLFIQALEVSPFITPEEATKYCVAAEISRGSCELILTGSSNETSEQVVDLIQQLELGMVDEDFTDEELTIFEEHANMMEQENVLAAMDEAYDALPDETKNDLTHLINMLTLDASELHSIVALEGDLDVPDSSVSAKVLSMPPANMQLPQEVHNDMRRILKSMMFDATHSANTTLLCASRIPMSNSVHVSGLGFKDGRWSDLGEEKTMFYLNATNVGDPLNLLPTDNIDYRNII